MWSRPAIALLAALLAGCTVAPLYGTGGAAPGGQTGRLAVEQVDTRVAQVTREALLRDFGRPQPGAATLTLNVTSAISNFLTDFETNRAFAGTATVTARYKLVGADGATLREGVEKARASFDAPLQEFANQRAIRDAEDRAAREAAARIRLAVAPALAGLAVPTVAEPAVDTAPERDPERP